jgi:hypothetical protein
MADPRVSNLRGDRRISQKTKTINRIASVLPFPVSYMAG